MKNIIWQTAIAAILSGIWSHSSWAQATQPVTGTEEQRGATGQGQVTLPPAPAVPANSQAGIAAKNTEMARNRQIPNAAMNGNLPPQNQPPLNPAMEGYAGPSTGVPVYNSQTPGQNPINNPMMDSQVEHAIIQSGNLPSQIEGAQMQAGPLAPGGIVPYLTPQDAAHLAPGPQGGAPTGPAAANMNQPMTGARASGRKRSAGPGAVDTRLPPTPPGQVAPANQTATPVQTGNIKDLQPKQAATQPDQNSLGNKP